ncbi:MAG: SDR family NAD(P)-dependent oxidoreductase, partial [Myxococcota bacterium]
PAQIEKRLNPLRKAEEIRSNVAAMQAHGATVVYERADMSDAGAVEDLVQRVMSAHGRLDVVIHGAGVEESRLIADKDLKAWHRVYDGKAIGGLALARAIPGDALLVTMGSVAGRFGNAGQVDYSAANDGLARMAVARGLTLHVDWTAWDDVGMAVRGGMKRLLTDRGVDLLPADAGAALLVDLVCAQATGEVVVAGGLGDFLPPPSHALLDTADNDGSTVTAQRSIHLDRDGWIADHTIGGNPVLPGVIGLELMAATALLSERGQAYAGAQDVRFSQPAKLYGGDPLALTMRATALGDGRVRAALSSSRTLRTGREQTTEHFAATVVVGMMPEIEGLPSAFLPDETVEKAAVYQRFFHGPVFQVITGVQGVSADALLAEAMVDHSAIADGLLTEPLVLEAAFQAAGLHHMITCDEMALPSGIDEVQLLGNPAAGELLTVLVRRRGDAYDVDVDTVSGPVLRMRGYAMATLGPLGPEDRFPPPEWERPTVFEDAEAPASSPNGAIARADADEDPSAWLTEAELAEVLARGTDRRKRDRVAGRIAAKRALAQLTGVTPLQIHIESAESGEPVATVPGWPTAHVSITHREGSAVAIATARGRVGVDVEAVQPRPDSFASTWFTQEERQVIGDSAERMTIAWSAKESVQKVLGQGMAISPLDIRVRSMSARGQVAVELVGRAAACHADLGGGRLTLVWHAEGDDRVLVEAHLGA